MQGVYLYGSIPLGAYDERYSDIDILCLTEGDVTPVDLDRLADLHTDLARRHTLARRLAVMYLPALGLGKRNSEVAPYPYVAEGEFHRSGHYDLNAVTWWLLTHHGTTLLGTPLEALPLDVPWQDVTGEMRYNLDAYWTRQMEGLAAHEEVVLDDYSVLYIVSTLCRILSTLEDGAITTKPQALQIWRDRLPLRFTPILDEALRIAGRSSASSLYRTPADLRLDVLSFMEYAIERGKDTLQQSQS